MGWVVMRYGVAVDPGLRGCGLAIFNLATQKLAHAQYVQNPLKTGNDFEAAMAMVSTLKLTVYAVIGPAAPELFWGECPKVYPAGGQKGDQNDLIHLAGFIYAIACSFTPTGTATRFYPREWKGTIEKETMLERIAKRLSPEESARILDAGALTHNVIDAVGIGLHGLGRLEPKRVFGGING